MNDAKDIADADQRAAALDPATSFIVRAPAGSGKTELLSQRYLRLLATVDNPEEIIALTFTRKAAAEMRQRVLGALREPGTEISDPSTHTGQRQKMAQAVLERDRAMHWELARNPGRLRIQTIDSLCAWLTRLLPLSSGFGSQPEVTEDSTGLYRQAARNTLLELESGRHWSNSIERLQRHLDNDLPRVEHLLAVLLARRDQWIRHMGSANRELLEQALKTEIEEALTRVLEQISRQQAAEIAQLACYAADHLCREQRQSPITACAGLRSLPKADAESAAAWRGIAGLLLTDDGDWRRQVDIRWGFPRPSAAGSPMDKAHYAEMKSRFASLIEKLRGNTPLRQQLHALRRLPPPGYEDSQWAVMQALFEMLPLAIAHLKLVFQEHHRVDFTEVALAAATALGEPEAPTDLALALDYRISHLLVDEFQDTSVSQYELLTRLTAGWQPGDGRTLFLVGDPMQSIYRFREAEVGLFLRAWTDRRLGGVPLRTLSLSVNFRSQSGIVEWVNQAFSQVMPARETVSDGAVPYSWSVAYLPSGPGHGVKIHPILPNDYQAEAVCVARIVRKAKDRGHSVAVLGRTRTQLDLIAVALREAGIRYQAIEIEVLGKRPVIRDLLSLTFALLHPADRAAWLAVLRAPWCGLTLADLTALAEDDHESTLWDLISDEHRVAGLSQYGQERLRQLREVFRIALQQRRRRSVRRWVEGVWLSLGGPACVDQTDMEDARSFFSCLETLEKGGDISDLAGLVTAVASLFASPDVEADDKVQVMTIHKAKGLEFDVVVVPGLGRTTRSGEGRLLMWMERTRADGGADLLLAPIGETGAQENPTHRYLCELHRAKDRLEEARLLYVAATRARRQLHLVGAVKIDQNGRKQVVPPPNGSLLRPLWPLVADDYTKALNGRGDIPLTSSDPVSRGPAQRSLKRLAQNWRLPEPPPGIAYKPTTTDHSNLEVEYAWAGLMQRQVGSVVHQFLQTIAEQGPGQWDEQRIYSVQTVIRDSLARAGITDGELEVAEERVVAALINTLRDPRGRWILDSGHGDAHSEYAISAVENSAVESSQIVNGIIDRTFIDEQEIRWIIDYKTGIHLGTDREAFLNNEKVRYRDQLERYAILMSRLDPRPIRLGLYFPLLGGWREWVFHRHA